MYVYFSHLPHFRFYDFKEKAMEVFHHNFVSCQRRPISCQNMKLKSVLYSTVVPAADSIAVTVRLQG